MRTAAVLPVKAFGRAKARLGGALSAGGRRELAAAMAGDVLAALDGVGRLDEVIVVTAEPRAVDAAHDAGATVVHDAEQAGQSAAAARGVEAAIARGFERVLLVPGDCPALEAAEVEALLGDDAAGAPGDGRGASTRVGRVVIVPDRHGSGTNALLLAPPDAVAPSFGPGSFARHAALARAAGATVKVCDLPSLGLDVDTPDDLGALREALDAHSGGAARTRAVLDRLVAA
jgi:2-phospho-L-lactate guanylyltransferase